MKYSKFTSIMLCMTIIFTQCVYAAMPQNSVVIDNYAYPIRHLFKSNNDEKLNNLVKSIDPSKIFYKANYINNGEWTTLKGDKISKDLIPMVHYIDSYGCINDYEEKDGELITDRTVKFLDSNLEKVVRQQINKPTGDILVSDALKVTYLDGSYAGIKDLSGIENLKNLRYLYLYGNQITDISRLEGLTQLTALELRDNQITDYSATKGYYKNLINKDFICNNINNLTVSEVLNKDGKEKITFNWTPDSLTSIINLKQSVDGGLTWTNATVGELTNTSMTCTLNGLDKDQLYKFKLVTDNGESNSVTINDSQVTFMDSNLENAVRKQINKSTGDILKSDALKVTYLYGGYIGIKDLSGIENLKNLEYLYLYGNQITDISELEGLTQLRSLDLEDNQIIDISKLNSLNNLTTLWLHGNKITDYSATKGYYKNLIYKDFICNNINDLTVSEEVYEDGKEKVTFNWTPDSLTSIINLKQSVDGGLTWTNATIDGLTNTSTTCTLNGLDKDQLYKFKLVTDNGESNSVIINNSQVIFKDSNLESLVRQQINKPTGDIFKSDVLKVTCLNGSYAGIKDLSGIENLKNLQCLYLQGNQIIEVSELEGLNKLTTLYLGENQITDYSPVRTYYKNLLHKDFQFDVINDFGAATTVCDATYENVTFNWKLNCAVGNIKLVQSTDYGVNWSDVTPEGLDVHSSVYALQKLNKDITYKFKLVTDFGESNYIYINDHQIIFPDKQLEEAIREKINRPEGDVLYKDCLKITDLNLDSKGIKLLDGIENFKNLSSLYLHNNKITQIDKIEGLTNLQYLDLSSNDISDISKLYNLNKLTNLDLSCNYISNIDSLKNLVDLESLDLGKNSLSDIRALVNLVNLNTLVLNNNCITDISPLNNLNNLRQLNLYYNNISNLKPLANNIHLTYLNIGKNQVNEISALNSLINLNSLELEDNKITDITCLSTLKKLECLFLTNNAINNFSVLSNLTELKYLELEDVPVSEYIDMININVANNS